MKPLLIPAVLIACQMAAGQIAAPERAGISMGHIHLNVTDIAAQKKFWIEEFDAKPLAKSGVEGVMLPGMLVLFTPRTPEHPSETTVLDHFGFKVHSRDEMVRICQAAGFVIPKQFTGSEGFPNAYVTGPDSLKIEMQQEASQQARTVAQHLHFLMPNYLTLRAWYISKFDMEETTRGPHESADIPGMNLTFANAKTLPQLGSAGGNIDHIGFEVTDIAETRRRLIAKGVNVGSIRQDAPAPGVRSAFLTDPVGTLIELTQGLNAWSHP